MEQLKHRIDALKRNVETTQKKEALVERHRQQLEQGIHNKEQKNLAKIGREEKLQQQLEEKRERVQSARRDRQMSRARSEKELKRQ